MTKMCRSGQHEMTEANTIMRADALGRTPRARCRTCETARRRARYAAEPATVKAAVRPPSSLPLGTAYRYQEWTDGTGRYYLRVEAELFEYTDDSLYAKQARKRLRENLKKRGIDAARLHAQDSIETVAIEHDQANPQWTVAMTVRTREPMFLEEEATG